MKTGPRIARTTIAAALVLNLFFLAGCGGTVSAGRSLPMFDGATGEALGWDDLMDRIAVADAIFIGEEHDDAVGHFFQQAVVHDAIAQLPGATAVSMEMLERHEQPLVDQYLAGSLPQQEFIQKTESFRWGSEREWKAWYQPMIDAARRSGAPVVAANAPRAIVRQAGGMSFDEMQALPEYTNGHFETPVTFDTNLAYRRRFLEVMHAPTEPSAEPAPAPAASHGESHNPHAGSMTYEMGMKTFRSQMIWDASMGAAVAEALEREDVRRAVHLAGRFHVQRGGGTISEFRARAPEALPLVIVLIRADADVLRDEDSEAGDIVVYTGMPEPEAEDG